MSASLKSIGSSVSGNHSPFSKSVPPEIPSAKHFFIQRFEFLTSNTSAPTWTPEFGLRFAEEPQLSSSVLNSRRNVQSRRFSQYEQVLQQPELFAPPLWHIGCFCVPDRQLLMIDMWVDVECLCRYVENGVSVTGRRLMIDSVRYVRAAITSHDGLDTCDNFIACFLWPDMRRLLKADSALTFKSLIDVRNIYEQCRVDEPDFLTSKNATSVRTKLYGSQCRTVNMMTKLETGTQYRPLLKGCVRMSSGDQEILIGEHDRFVHNTSDMVSIRGGYLANSMGSGKTLCMISTSERLPRHHWCLKRPKATLVICPAQVVQHWVDELGKHIQRPLVIKLITTRRDLQSIRYDEIACADYVIVSFNFFCNPQFREFSDHYSPLSPFNVRCETLIDELDRVAIDELGARLNPFLMYFHWHRVIVDEFHELDQVVHSNVTQAVMSLQADIRWMISGSPFMNAAAMIRNIRQFMWPACWSEYGIIIHIMKHHVVYDKNCHVKLPQLTEKVLWTKMTQTERSVYEGLQAHGRLQQLRACASIGITSIVQNAPLSVSNLDEMHAVIRSHMKLEHEDVTSRLNLVRERLQTFSTNDPLDGNTRFAQLYRESRAEEERLGAREKDIARSLTFLEHNLPTVSTSDCPICLCTMPNEVAVIKSCGHAFCKECLSIALSKFARCPSCRMTASMNGKSVVVMNSLPLTPDEELRSRYGTKMATLLKFLDDNVSHKIIIFSQWDEFLKDVAHVVKRQTPVLFCRGSVKQKQCSIDKFKTSPDHNVIMLSTLNSGSGCDLSVADMVIMLDIVDGPQEYVLSVERQAISRCYRVGQAKDVTVVRLLAENTVESDVYDQTYTNIDYTSFYGFTT